jgi:prolyl oligopeptidase
VSAPTPVTLPPPAPCEARFGTLLCDPERWLEDTGDPRVVDWLRAHDERARARFDHQATADALYRRMIEIAVGRSKPPPEASPGTPPPGSKPRPTLRRGADGVELVRPDGQTSVAFPSPPSPYSLGAHRISGDARYACVERVIDGHDRRELLVRALDDAAGAPDVLEGIDGGEVVWDPARQGLYYSYQPAGVPHPGRFGSREIRFHRVGSAQTGDPIIVEASGDRNASSAKEPLALVKGRYLLAVLRGVGEQGPRLRVVDVGVTPPLGHDLVAPDGMVDGAREDDGKLVITVEHPDGWRSARRVAAWGPSAPEPLRRFGPADHYVGSWRVGPYVIVRFGAGSSERYEVCDRDLHRLMEWTAPPGETQSFEAIGDDLRVRTSGLQTVEEVAQVSPRKQTSTVVWRAQSPWDPDRFVVEVLEASSEDGARVPVTVLRGKATPLDGTAALWTHVYGGFRWTQISPFSPMVAAWVESGGVYAVVHARGGLEWGREWNAASLRTRHMLTVFDYAAGVRALQAKGYGRPATTMLEGLSHGGLIASRTGVGWPDLASVVLARVPLVDMVHFAERGRGGVPEYGDPDNWQELASLLQLSTLHALRPTVRYPAFFVTGASHDERVDLMHPAKLVGALERLSPETPVFLKVDWRGGHLGGGPEDPERATAEALAWLRERTAAELGRAREVAPSAPARP